MNVSLLVDRWEKNKNRMMADDFIRELKMCVSGDLRPGYTLDSVCHMKKHAGKTWKAVIECDPVYVNWCLENLHWFQLDETAHNYLIENGG